MVAINRQSLTREESIAQLTDVAYRAVLERGFRGSFLDLELSLWSAIRDAVERMDRGRADSPAHAEVA